MTTQLVMHYFSIEICGGSVKVNILLVFFKDYSHLSRVISLMGDLLSWKLLQVNHLIQNHLTQKANCLWKLHCKENQRGIITQILYYPGHLPFLLQRNSVFNRLMCLD